MCATLHCNTTSLLVCCCVPLCSCPLVFLNGCALPHLKAVALCLLLHMLYIDCWLEPQPFHPRLQSEPAQWLERSATCHMPLSSRHACAATIAGKPQQMHGSKSRVCPNVEAGHVAVLSGSSCGARSDTTPQSARAPCSLWLALPHLRSWTDSVICTGVFWLCSDGAVAGACKLCLGPWL